MPCSGSVASSSSVPPSTRSVTAMWKPLSMIALPSRFACQPSSASANDWPVALDAEVDVARRAAERRGRLAGRDVVDRDGAAERHVEVRMRVDRAREHELAGGVDHPVGSDVERRADQRYPLALDEHVGDGRVGCRHDPATLDQHGHGASSRPVVRPGPMLGPGALMLRAYFPPGVTFTATGL